MVNQYEFKDLKNVINYFFATPELEELNMKFKEPIILTKEQYKELIGHPDGSNGVINNDVNLDEFTYDEYIVEGEGNEEREVRILAKISIEYTLETSDDKDYLEIYEINMWRERID